MIDEIVREGARRMLAEALRAEVDAYLAAFVDERGHRLVVRNGYHQPREVLTSGGAVEVTAPRVNDKRVDPATGERTRFSSAILPPWARKTPKITEVMPLLYLREALLERAELDQRARCALGDPPTDEQWQTVGEIDAGNTDWLTQFIADHGWPGVWLAGTDGAHAAWLIAQHASPQERARRLPRVAVDIGDACARDLAYLQNRVNTDAGLAQRFGTQWLVRDGQGRLLPIQDPVNVNAVRATVTLPPLRDTDLAAAWPLTATPPRQGR